MHALGPESPTCLWLASLECLAAKIRGTVVLASMDCCKPWLTAGKSFQKCCADSTFKIALERSAVQKTALPHVPLRAVDSYSRHRGWLIRTLVMALKFPRPRVWGFSSWLPQPQEYHQTTYERVVRISKPQYGADLEHRGSSHDGDVNAQEVLGVVVAVHGAALMTCRGQSSHPSKSGVAANKCSVAVSNHLGHLTTHHTVRS
jgi:hypothetical protein